MVQRRADLVILVLLWVLGVGLTIFVALERNSSFEVVISGPLGVSLECAWLWWVFRKAEGRERWMGILVGAGIPFLILVPLVLLILHPNRLAPTVRWGAYAYAGYQVVIVLTLLLYGVILRYLARAGEHVSERSESAA